MTLEVGGREIDVSKIRVPVSGVQEEKDVHTTEGGIPLMSDESVDAKPYFVMYLLDMPTMTHRLVNLPISAFLFQDMIDFDVFGYLEQSLYRPWSL